jgi:hypothetical protein
MNEQQQANIKRTDRTLARRKPCWRPAAIVWELAISKKISIDNWHDQIKKKGLRQARFLPTRPKPNLFYINIAIYYRIPRKRLWALKIILNIYAHGHEYKYDSSIFYHSLSL